MTDETSWPNAVSGAICGASRPIAVTWAGEAARPLLSSKHFPPAAGTVLFSWIALAEIQPNRKKFAGEILCQI